LDFFKKLVIADNLNQYILAKQPFFDVMEVPERWLFLMALTFRIYYDFCGYTDIALGLAMTMGIKLPQNFRAPYKASNIRDFWQRWHMSLSFWIRDYIYIPLGGSKHGALRRVINGLVAFALCGLWHGASYNYLLWGLYHGSALAINNYYRQLVWLKPLAGFFDRYPRASQASTFLFVASGWLLFFYPAARAWQMWLLLFGIKGVAGD
jgi:alginate O-acetyltransferase complex protein AlgI